MQTTWALATEVYIECCMRYKLTVACVSVYISGGITDDECGVCSDLFGFVWS